MIRRTRTRVTLGIAIAALLVVAAACNGDDEDVATPTPTEPATPAATEPPEATETPLPTPTPPATPTPTPSPTPTPEVEAPPGVDLACVRGEFVVQAFDGRRPLQVLGEEAPIEGAGSDVRLVLLDDMWLLTDDGETTFLGQVGDTPVTIEITGTVMGTLSFEGDQYLFLQTFTRGSGVFEDESGQRVSLPMEQLAPGIAPSGGAVVTCEEDIVRLESDSMSLILGRPDEAS